MATTFKRDQISDGAINNAKLASDTASLAKVSGGRMYANGTSVGINAPAPSSSTRLQVDLDGTADYIYIRNTNGSSNNNAVFRVDARSGITNTLRVDRNGRVGINASSLTDTLHVGGTIRATDGLKIGDTTRIDSTGRYIAPTGQSGESDWVINANNGNIKGVNRLEIEDPGSNEGILWNGTSAGWVIDVSPETRGNGDGNLNLYGTANSIVLWRPTKLKGDTTNLIVEGEGESSFAGSVKITGALSVESTVSATGNISSGGVFLASGGSASIPAFSFTGDPDTGIYNSSANALAFATGGGARFLISGSSYIRSYLRHRFLDGTLASPGITFTNDTDTGFFRSATDTISVVTYAKERLKVSPEGAMVTGELKIRKDDSATTEVALSENNGNLEISGDVSFGKLIGGEIPWSNIPDRPTINISAKPDSKSKTNLVVTNGSNILAQTDIGVSIKDTPEFNQIVLGTAGTSTTHAVRADRSISTGTGLSGGGNLTANRTLSLDTGYTDGRYVRKYGYTKSVESAGWYRIAMNGTIGNTSGGDRAHAMFTVIDTQSGYHSATTFYASYNYGSNPTLNLISRSFYNSHGRITKIRIVSGGVYAGAAVEVYVSGAASSVSYTMFDNYHSSGWTAVDWVPVDEAVPSGYTATQLDLDTHNPAFAIASGSNSNAFIVNRAGEITSGSIRWSKITNRPLLVDGTGTTVTGNLQSENAQVKVNVTYGNTKGTAVEGDSTMTFKEGLNIVIPNSSSGLRTVKPADNPTIEVATVANPTFSGGATLGNKLIMNAFGTAGEQRPYIELQGVHANDANNENGGAFIKFKTSTSSGYGPEIGGIRIGSGLGDFLIKTGSNNVKERVRVTDAGSVGIGTSSPLEKLHVMGNLIIESDSHQTDGHLQVHRSSSSEGNTLRFVISSNPGWQSNALDSGSITLVAEKNADFAFGYKTSETLPFVIKSSGNVGINTRSPAEKLQVEGYIRVSSGIKIGSTTIINSSRNMTNIGTISSGAITSSGKITGASFETSGNISAKNIKATRITIPAGQKTATWTHSYGSDNYAISYVTNSPSRHVYLESSTPTVTTIALDDVHDEPITVHLTLTGW